MAIRIEACARLHLGMIDLNGELGRKFGSLGVAIQRPRVIVDAAPADRLVVQGRDAGRAEKYARRLLERYAPGTGADLRVVEAIPAHVGLGSGTQLALAVGMALNQMLGLGLEVADLAVVMGRGGRSGIGVGTFKMGGFVADGGSVTKEQNGSGNGQLPPIVFHHPFPEEWRFVVAIPAAANGLSGEIEDHAFIDLPPTPPELPGQISRLLVMKLLPALLEDDIESFGQALTNIQYLVGDSFAAMQGGRFAYPASEDVVRLMLDVGAKGAGQSSWGPAVYGLAPNIGRAEEIAAAVRELVQRTKGGDVFVTAAANTGWVLSRHASPA